MDLALKDRITPYISVRAAGLTFAALTGLSLLTIIGLSAMKTGSEQTLSLNVTVPLGGEHTVEAMGDPVKAGDLQTADMHADPEAAPVTEPKKAYRPPVEDAVAGLHESTPYGMVPVIRKSDGMTAFKAYSSEFAPAADARAMISLVMVDYGLSKKASDAALEQLPEGVTLALSPYGQDVQTWTTSARQRGHEVWMGLPLQSESFGTDDSGAQTLLVSASLEQNKNRLLGTLGKATGYAGIIDLDTPGFSSSSADLDRIYSSILERGLALAQANPKDTVTGDFAITHKAPFIQNDIWIDENAAPKEIAKQLDKLKNLAADGHTAVGFFHPYPTVIAAIRKWQEDLVEARIELAPLSASIEQK
jgi:hypothetical protein